MPRPRASEVLHPVRNLQRAFEEDERRARKRGRPTDGLGTDHDPAAAAPTPADAASERVQVLLRIRPTGDGQNACVHAVGKRVSPAVPPSSLGFGFQRR